MLSALLLYSIFHQIEILLSRPDLSADADAACADAADVDEESVECRHAFFVDDICGSAVLPELFILHDECLGAEVECVIGEVGGHEDAEKSPSKPLAFVRKH